MPTEDHRVFSLKYRPAAFDELVGQPHVRQTLVNTLLRRQVGHGYIFSGPRGVGKTTVARLFAKALNCEQGSSPKICNKCDICREIAAGNCLDVIEMDGASNRKIEDVRALRENVRFAPARARYKIYIIDEVHMLTQEAFNALLKTLEEPPDHVVFMMATTDPQKIPETIHSRCQELEFHRISPADLSALLSEVCRKEKISIDAESVAKLSEWADGSARDALVALEQAAAFSDGDIREEWVDRLFGWVDRKTVESVIAAVMHEDQKTIFDLARKIEEDGKDVTHFLVQLARHFRHSWSASMEGKLPKESPLRGCSSDALLRMIAVLLESERNLRGTRQPGLFLAVKLIELIELKRSIPLSDIVQRLEAMELRLTAGGSASGGVEVGRIVEKEKRLPSPAHIWQKLMESVSSEDVRLAAWLKEGKPAAFILSEKVLPVVYDRRFILHQQRLSAEKNKAVVEEALSKLLGEAGWQIRPILAAGEESRDVVPAQDIPTAVRVASELFESKDVKRRG